MATPARTKLKLWASRRRGIKSRVFSNARESVQARDDIPNILVSKKIDRGDALQKARLRFYPSINVDYDLLFAGKVDEGLDVAEDMLLEIGFRNNPTAYVEVTEKHGPDDGSYSLQHITETGGRLNIPRISQQPSYWKRAKRQIHVTLYQTSDGTEMLAHEEISAWLQPARHVVEGDVTARVGVRDFRDLWFDEFGEELSGRSEVLWDTTH